MNERKSTAARRMKRVLFKGALFFLFVLSPAIAVAQQTISGVVQDAETKEPLIGVVVNVKSTPTAVTTDENGKFSIRAAEGSIIRFSLLSYTPVEKKVSGKDANWNILLEPDAETLGEVVVEAGIIKRDKLGFTGSFSSVSNEELKSVGNTNVLQSLKSLDAGFVILDNLEFGSDPNALPNIEIRGQTTLDVTGAQNLTSSSDESSSSSSVASNMPLFILDGFEATLAEINDLDINRVESITLLKDAGSTAIYGSKGANGVVVIETVKPKQGEVFISYSGEFKVAAPDLSVYNMMNAAEKLEFERIAHRYDYVKSNDYDVSIPANYDGQKLYYDRLAAVQRGVDTYWLSEPVRNALTHSHSITVSGGDKKLLYSVGANYKQTEGVMKDVYHNTFGGNVKLIYRMEGLNIMNNLSVQDIAGHEGSWGSFSNFVNANPYFTKYDEYGQIPKYLDSNGDVSAANPLWNASLLTRMDSEEFIVTNNTAIDWNVTSDLLLRGSLSLKKNKKDAVNFTDPRNTKYDNMTYDTKGEYRSTNYDKWTYNANLSVNYMKRLKKHNFTVIARGSIDNASEHSETFIARGFPEGSVGFPSQAYSYAQNSRPSYTEEIKRTMTLIGAFNYNYDFRYLFDFNYNLDGSTRFGTNRRFQNFWSAGLGWNVHREEFAKKWKTWLDELKFRATYGTNGNQTGSYVTSSIFSYYVGNNFFGQSAYMDQVGNPDLRWQLVKNLSGGVDLGLFKNNLKLNFDIYQKKTDPLIISLQQQASTGVTSYPANLGYMTTKGYEFKVYYNLIKKPKDNFLVALRFTGGHSYSTYGGFQKALDYLNEAYQYDESVVNKNTSLQSLVKYSDGNSPSDLWAVRSLGIDPANGREIFLTKDGNTTYIYNPDDKVVIANSRPDLEGIVGFTVNYKKIMLSANMRYSVGGYKFNEALFNKVENITSSNIVYNQDKRALYERWQQIGDVAQYRSAIVYTVSSNLTPVSSRFIQKDNYLRGESFQLTWNFTGDKWIKSMGLKDLSASLSMEDFFNLYSIHLERGTSSPFQRAASLKLSARF